MLGGLEKVQIEYINYLLENKDYEVAIVIENDNGPANELEDDIKGDIIYLKGYNYIQRIKRARDNRKKSFLSKIKYNYLISKERKYTKNKFFQVYNTFNPDVVIDFDSSLNKFVEELKGSKNLVWVHSSVKKWKKTSRRINNFCNNLLKYHKVVCICKEMQEELHELSPQLEGKTEFIYNPIDFETIKLKANEMFSEEDEILANRKFILSVSRLDCVPKDFDTLFKGYEKAVEMGYEGELYIIGDGPDRKEVERIIKDRHSNLKIKLLGRRTNPYNWMKKAEVFILSSRYEGFPTVLLESLTVGTKTISSLCKTGPREILDNGFVGELFPVGDVESLAKAIMKKDRLDEANLSIHLKKFDRKNIFSKLEDLLEEK